MPSPGDNSKQVQSLGLILFAMFLAQIPSVYGSNVLWDDSDLIVEGKITEIRIQEGEPIGISAISRVIKSNEITSIYTKGLEHGSEVMIKSPDFEVGQNQRLYLERVGESDYLVIKAEPIPEPAPNLDYGSIGLFGLTFLAVIAYYILEK